MLKQFGAILIKKLTKHFRDYYTFEAGVHILIKKQI